MAVSTVLESGDQATAKTAESDAIEVRIRRLRAGFIRQLALKGRPNTLLQTLVDHAARSTAAAELAMLDSSVSANDRVRLSGEARRARLELQQAIAARPAPQQALGGFLKAGAHA